MGTITLDQAIKSVQTQILAANDASIALAAELLREGKLVAFPTETVYGLGADALDSAAVARIFAAKGRPSCNPLIVHVASIDQARSLASHWPGSAQLLSRHFWPGPLTLVLPASTQVPELVRAGGATVALRMPAHPVAVKLLRAVGRPLAAPSANRSSQLSPTRADHVASSLGGIIPLVLDGGACINGIESTVIDLSVEPAVILRPGPVQRAELAALLGVVMLRSEKDSSESLRSPGLLARHYAPASPLQTVRGSGEAEVRHWIEQGMRVGWLPFGEARTEMPAEKCVVLAMPKEAANYGAHLYAALHSLDAVGVDRIVVGLPPLEESWLAIHDRLDRASAPMVETALKKPV